MFSKIPQIAAFTVCILALGQVHAADAPTSCVWKLEGAGGTTVYLAGSVHLLRQKDHPLPGTYDQVYEDSERIYFEVDMSEMESPENAMKMLQMSMLPDGKTLEDVLSADTYSRLNAYLSKGGMAGNPMLTRLNPGMMGITISALEAMKIGAMPDLGVEKIYDTKAREDGKEIIGLETAEFQINMLKRVSDKDGDQFIAMTLDDIEDSPEKLGELIDAWKKGDAKTMDEMINEEFDPQDKLAQILLFERNANWIPAIEKELERTDGNAMIIVGAGHLVGKGSVLDMLAKKGIKATQM